MNRDQIEGKWEQLKGSVKEKWGKLTDDDLKQIGGKSQKLLGKLQERYGMATEKAERELDAFLTSCDSCSSDSFSSTDRSSSSERSARH